MNLLASLPLAMRRRGERFLYNEVIYETLRIVVYAGGAVRT